MGLAQFDGDAFMLPADHAVRSVASHEVAAISFRALGFGVAVPWGAGGVEGRRRMIGDVWRAVDFEQGLAHALRAWTRGGGLKAMAKERGRLRGRDETRRAARVVDWLERRGLRPDSALAALGNARRLLRQPMHVRSRMLRNQEVGYGFAPDGRGRWAVESILEWRGDSSRREALVRWCGFSPVSGAPWADSWESRSRLTSDLRSGGTTRRRRTAVQIRTDARQEREDWDERHTHTRKSSRLQGEDSEEEN